MKKENAWIRDVCDAVVEAEVVAIASPGCTDSGVPYQVTKVRVARRKLDIPHTKKLD